MNCPNCNTFIKDGMKFCPKCGTKVESSPTYREIGGVHPVSDSGELKALTCPHCGANTTNTQNCEYCGSLLVRFVDKGIDIEQTSYISKKSEYPGVLTELKKNLQLQKLNPNQPVCTDIYWQTKDENACLYIGKSGTFNWMDGTPIELGEHDGGLTVLLDFSTYFASRYYKVFNELQDEHLKKFKQLKSFPLFTSHTCSYKDQAKQSRFARSYAIDFGKDAEGAAVLISEILSEVEGLNPTDNYDVFTNVGFDSIENARDAWTASHGLGGGGLLESLFGSSDNTYDDDENYTGLMFIIAIIITAIFIYLKS